MFLDNFSIENSDKTLTIKPNLLLNNNNKQLAYSTEPICLALSNKNKIITKKTNNSLTKQTSVKLKNSNQNIQYSIKKKYNKNLLNDSIIETKQKQFHLTELLFKCIKNKNFLTKKNYDSQSFLKVRIQTLCLIAAFFPGIGCLFCISYTYLFQFDVVKKFTSTHCNNINRFIYKKN